MILKSARVRSYKNTTDSGVVEFEAGITCLVGKNESGKSAFLESLYRLNPLPTGHPQSFEALRDYPRRTFSHDREAIPTTIPIEVVFTLEPADVAAIEEKLGVGVLAQPQVRVQRTYENDLVWEVPLREQRLIDKAVVDAGLDASIAAGFLSIEDLVRRLKRQSDPAPEVKQFIDSIEARDFQAEIRSILAPRLPRFLYFDEFSIMPGRVSIPKLQQTPPNLLTPGERTALALLKLAGVDSKECTEADYEGRRAALESAANQLTDEMFEYWSQNKELLVELDVDFRSPGSEKNGIGPFLDIRIRDRRHRVTLNFGERSQGFIWFFSFLSAFSEYRSRQEPLILLLDEPGLGLHPLAQSDLMRFIEERLGSTRQVLYSTHSPFMVEASRLDRVRTVEDIPEVGAKISADVMSSTRETRFPLQVALGYELARNLLEGPNNLLVEGPSDYLYLKVISDYLRSQQRPHLDRRWVIVPIGGMCRIPALVSLLGAQASFAVILDGIGENHAKAHQMVQRRVLSADRVVPLPEIARQPEAGLEDFFEVDFYAALLAESGTATVRPGRLLTGGGIVKQIEDALGADFDRYQPARYFLEHQATLLPRVGRPTLERFEQLFQRLNRLLAPAEQPRLAA
ncbi:MAG: hypothetical protein A2W00_04310 [Candidatus Eisenbacteria bacterium RBG_16_71_46]|nr:MAG: hypothetical protein A2W00_04310 [Candidatus Eisenbacteria bacterium RBG_16_71_46]